MVVSGLDESGAGFQRNPDVELFTPSADMNGRGTVSLLGTLGGAGQPPIGGLYPHMFAMPSGRTLVAGPFPEDSWSFNPPGATNSFTWQDFPGSSRDRLWGTGVLVPGGTDGSTRVMQLGGSAPPTITSTTTDIAVPTTEIFDDANPSAGWQADSSMQVGRGHHNTVLLPDGSMVTVGGGVGIRNGDQWEADAAQRQVELRDPATGAWRLGAAQAESRAYHSTALLLPDGRVVSAGDDVNGGTAKDTAEIYEPPYLFKGARPAITAAPRNVRFATSFNVGTPNTNVTGAALVAPGATTHANDMNQRYIPLTVAQRAGGVTLTAPANPDVATPGYYMLFLLNDRGVPSVARFVSLGFVDDPPPTDPSGSCVKAAKTVKGKTLSRARLGRKRKVAATYPRERQAAHPRQSRHLLRRGRRQADSRIPDKGAAEVAQASRTPPGAAAGGIGPDLEPALLTQRDRAWRQPTSRTPPAGARAPPERRQEPLVRRDPR